MSSASTAAALGAATAPRQRLLALPTRAQHKRGHKAPASSCLQRCFSMARRSRCWGRVSRGAAATRAGDTLAVMLSSGEQSLQAATACCWAPPLVRRRALRCRRRAFSGANGSRCRPPSSTSTFSQVDLVLYEKRCTRIRIRIRMLNELHTDMVVCDLWTACKDDAVYLTRSRTRDSVCLRLVSWIGRTLGE